MSAMVEDGQFTYIDPFWQQPLWRWDAMVTTGVRAAFVASQHCRSVDGPGTPWAHRQYLVLGGAEVPRQHRVRHREGGDGQDDVGHGARIEIARRDGRVALPRLVRTEAVLAAGCFDLSNSESPEFIGRVIAALAADPNVSSRNGATLVAAAVAEEYGVTDVDGRRPRPVTLADV